MRLTQDVSKTPLQSDPGPSVFWLVLHLGSRGVEVKIHYPIPVHLQEYAAGLGYSRGDLLNAERQAADVITLPSHQHLTPEHMAHTVDCVREFDGA